jgi:hypothetical protein
MPLNEEARTRIREAWANWTPTPGIIGSWAVFKNGVIFHCGRTAIFPRRAQATRAKNDFLASKNLSGVSRWEALEGQPKIFYPAQRGPSTTPLIDRYSSLVPVNYVVGTANSRARDKYFYDEELQAEIASMFVVRQVTAEDLVTLPAESE